MYTVHLLDDNEAAGQFSTQLRQQIAATQNHRHAAAYASNINGILQDIGSDTAGQWFVKVTDNAGRFVATGKLLYRNGNVDISEIVKFPGMGTPGGMLGPIGAVMACALDLCDNGNRPTLTAATFGLIAIYENYGFVCEGGVPQHLRAVLRPNNQPMRMSANGQLNYQQNCAKGVFWDHSMAWID